MAKTITTSELWDATNTALHGRQWSRARALLDDLGLRRDNHDQLLDAACYGMPESSPYHAIIQDRIDLVNARA